MQAGRCRYPPPDPRLRRPNPHLSDGEEAASPTWKPQPPSRGPAATEGSVRAAPRDCRFVPGGQAAPAAWFTDEPTEAREG